MIQSGFLALAVAESSQSGLSFLPSLSLLLLEQLTNRLFRGYLCKQEGFHKERHLSFYKENARSKFSSSSDSCIPHKGWCQLSVIMKMRDYLPMCVEGESLWCTVVMERTDRVLHITHGCGSWHHDRFKEQSDSYHTCFMFVEWGIDMSTLPHTAWSRYRLCLLCHVWYRVRELVV